MKIRKLKVHNWRSIKDVEIDFQDLMILVGQNNHGKSNIFSAILFFFGSVQCSELDFNSGSEEIFVEITFDTLDEKDKNRFKKYVAEDGTLCVRRQISKGETAEYHGYINIPQEDWLKEEKVAEFRSRTAIKETPLAPLVPQTGTLTNGNVRDAQAAYIEANRDQITFTRGIEEGNFMGQKSLSQATFGEIFYIPAVKNAADDFNPKGKNPFNSLLTSVINDMSATNPAYIGVKEKIRDLTATLSKKLADGSENGGRPHQISRLEEILETELATWNTKIDIDIATPDVDEALRLGTNVVIDDGVRTDINRKGNGLQRSLIFALIKAWAKVSQEDRQKREIEGEDSKESKSSYFLFEEPELYLHPQAQRELFSSLKALSKNESQVFLSTHSSSFIDLGLSVSLCVVCKNSLEEGTKCLQYNESLFQAGEEEKQFSLTYYINPDRGELFFAKKVILVEGQTDKSVITYVAKKHLEVYRYDYTIVDCGSKNNIPLFMRLLNKFHLPYVAVYDRDHQAIKNQQALDVADRDSALIESALDSDYGSLVVLENDIEEEINAPSSGEGGKPFRALQHVSSDDFACTDAFKEKLIKIYS